MNGALTIGTLDGANVEIREEVGAENIFIFGLREEQIREWRESGYDPRQLAAANEELTATLDMIRNNHFCPSEPALFEPIVSSLLDFGDPYMLLADFDSYATAQERVSRVWRDQEHWTRMSILNVAAMGPFSSDRTIQEYASEIWGVRPVGVNAREPARGTGSARPPGERPTRAASGAASRKAASRKAASRKAASRKAARPPSSGRRRKA